MNEEEKPKRIFYTEAQKRATYAFREKNRDSYNAYQRQYHQERMRTDLDYRNRKAAQSIEANRRAREKKKAEKLAKIILQKQKENQEVQSSIDSSIITSF